MSFRETREMLLQAYDGKIISDEEFSVLWESCRSKNPDFPYSSYARFDHKDINKAEPFNLNLNLNLNLKSLF